MTRVKVLVVLGTRPEAIKLAPVIKAFQQHPGIDVSVCSTGQHREMLRPLLEFFDVKPDVDLDLMSHAQSPAEMAGRALNRLSSVLAQLKPDWVVVQGDTTTAFAAALAAFYSRIRVAHVEAGLRTQDKWTPFPEEMNRRLISRIAELHFAPTAQSADALYAENIPRDQIAVTGNTVIDALFETRGRLAQEPVEFGAESRLVLMTMHRRENFDRGVASICDAVGRFAEHHPDVSFLFPVHPNPAVKEPVQARLRSVPNIRLTEPLAYPELIAALDRADVVLTDSGGIQEEGAALGKPIIVMRDDTERPEAVRNGNAILVGSNTEKIYDSLKLILFNAEARRAMQKPCTAYGDGQAAQRIANVLIDASATIHGAR